MSALTLFWQGPAVLQAKAGSPTLAQPEVLPEKVILPNFIAYSQWYNLSCEYSAIRTMTAFWKREIPEDEFIRAIPVHPNPHIGYRGNIHGPFGGTRDYGIYAEPIARMLEGRGWKTKLLAGREQALKQELALGRPITVWVIGSMGWSSPYTSQYDGLQFKLAGGEHTVVIYGYDARGVYVAEPAYGGHDYYDWQTFLRSWAYLDYMAMSIWPESSEQTTVGGTGTAPISSSPGVSPYFYRHWLNFGGREVLGYPIALASTEAGSGKIVQYFERARLEYDPTAATGASDPTILHGLLGQELIQSQGRESEPAFRPVTPHEGPTARRYFAETGHTISQGFQAYWEGRGGLPVFGYPLSEEFVEDGKIVQYFQRARFEYHPHNDEPYQILLSRLGFDRLASVSSSTNRLPIRHNNYQ